MSNLGKTIILFVLVFDILMFSFGYSSDLGWFGGTGTMSNNTMGFYFNTTSQELIAPSVNSTMVILGLGVLGGLIILGGAVTGRIDIGGAIRLSLALVLLAFTAHAVAVVNSIPDVPFGFKMLVGMVLGVAYIISCFEFLGGVDL